ncbi:MAG: hypothetical protein GXO04_03120 [Aquificae bacterium]|nr:hypothetical protein [Aquificota bacterium]
MLRFEDYELALVIVLTRFLEALAIVLSIFLAMKGYKLRYVVLTVLLVALSVGVSVGALAFREHFALIVSANLLLTFTLLSLLILYVVKNPERTKSFSPPPGARCPVCNVLILRDDDICTAKIGDYTYFFDSCDHLVQLLKDPKFFLERKSVYPGKLKEVYVKTKDTKRWKDIKNVKLVERDGKLFAYEKAHSSAESVSTEELLKRAQNVLGGGN